jgi:hypothetical protein
MSKLALPEQYIRCRGLSLCHPKKSISFLWLAFANPKLHQEANAAAPFDLRWSARLSDRVIGRFVIACIFRNLSGEILASIRLPWSVHTSFWRRFSGIFGWKPTIARPESG